MEERRMFDPSTIPDDLCPIATELLVLKTGDWRAERPVVDRRKCVKCGACWIYCPCQCLVERPTWFEVDLELCKGCGICSQECPHHAITMIEEKE